MSSPVFFPPRTYQRSADNINWNGNQKMLIFEWDLKKAKTNLGKHGVFFEEASTAFKNTLSLTIDDPLHSCVSSVNYFFPLATIIFPHCLWSVRGGMRSERREPVGRPEFTPHPASGSICSFCFFPFAPENLHKPSRCVNRKLTTPEKV